MNVVFFFVFFFKKKVLRNVNSEDTYQVPPCLPCGHLCLLVQQDQFHLSTNDSEIIMSLYYKFQLVGLHI